MPALSQTIDPSIYGNQEAPKGTSLADLINIGKGSLELQKAKELYQPSIEKAKAETRQAVTQADTSNLENILKHTNAAVQSQQRLLVKPDLKAEDILNAVKEHAKNTGAPESSVNQALAGLPQNGTPTELRGWLAQTLTKTLSNQQQLEKLYPGGVLPAQLPQSYQASPATAEGGYSAGGQAPKGVTPDQMSQGPKAEFSKPVPLSYPVRQAGQAYSALPQEEDERKVGTAMKTSLISRQAEIPQSERTVNRVIEKALELEKSATLPTSGFLGSFERGASTFLGTEQGIRYKELSKDLANAAIANIRATGGSMDTVQGQQLTRMANGDETFPPKVLIEIAERTKADMSAINSKATAVKKFADKFGDQNISAFNQMWSKNADPDIFQLKNIFEDANMSAEEKAKARDRILGKDPAKAKIFNEKWNNIKRLEQTGTL